MRKLLLLLLVFTSLACSKEDDPEINSFSVEASVEHQGNVLPVDQEFTVYYFEGINVTNGYSPHTDGILIENETGDPVSYTEKFVVNNHNGIVVFKDLPKEVQSVIVDVSNTFREDIDIETIFAKAFNMELDNIDPGYGIELTFHISPYSPSTVICNSNFSARGAINERFWLWETQKSRLHPLSVKLFGCSLNLASLQ